MIVIRSLDVKTFTVAWLQPGQSQLLHIFGEWTNTWKIHSRFLSLTLTLPFTSQMAATAQTGQAETEARKCILVSHADGRKTSIWSIFHCFSNHIRMELDQTEQQGLELVQYGIWYYKQQLNTASQCQALNKSFFKRIMEYNQKLKSIVWAF